MPTPLRKSLDLPTRTTKPRTTGLTVLIDSGQSSAEFAAKVSDFSTYIDAVKFSFGTSAVTPPGALERKIECLTKAGIDYFFGGTLMELYVLQKNYNEYLELCHEYGCALIEISNGVLPLSNHEKAELIKQAVTDGLRVLSEVGHKDQARSKALSAQDWIAAIRSDLAAGAEYVITEARESGTSGLADVDGRLRIAVVKDILESGLPIEHLIFEAPTKELQTGFITRLGANVNLANIAFTDIIALESLRQGLRADTMMHFHGQG